MKGRDWNEEAWGSEGRKEGWRMGEWTLESSKGKCLETNQSAQTEGGGWMCAERRLRGENGTAALPDLSLRCQELSISDQKFEAEMISTIEN